MHLMMKEQVTLTKAEGHKWRSKVTQNKEMVVLRSFKPIVIIPGTEVQNNKRHLMTSTFLTFMKGQGQTTRSKVTDVEVFAFSECLLLLMNWSPQQLQKVGPLAKLEVIGL